MVGAYVSLTFGDRGIRHEDGRKVTNYLFGPNAEEMPKLARSISG